MAVRIKGIADSGVSRRWAVSWAEAASAELKQPTAELAIVFITPAAIKKLNGTYRKKLMVTDVLSFPADTDHDLGDIFIAPVVAKKKAKERGMGYREYLKLLIVHSVLHLGGYDHHTEKESARMEKMEKKILKK